MQPTLPLECEIEIVAPAAGLRLGQLIVFAVGDTLVAHRLVGRQWPFLVAQGDNRRGPDRPLRGEQVLGIVTCASVEGRQVWPRQGEKIWALLWLARYHALRPLRCVWLRTR